MNILAARKYKSRRQGKLSQAEAETRRIAYAIKDQRSPVLDFETAAREMAPLIESRLGGAFVAGGGGLALGRWRCKPLLPCRV